MTAAAPRIARFDLNQRVLHWVNAALFAILFATAAVLYVDPISALVGRRAFVRQVHVVAGLALPVPFVVALLGPWRRGLRADVTVLARWDDIDRRWLRSLGRRGDGRWGKFHPGQKLNAAVTLGFIGVLLGTGAIMRWFGPFPLSWRTGATFVHDWTALVTAIVVAGHIRMALGDRPALSSMVRGSVPAEWARRHRPRWYLDVTGQPDGGRPANTSPGPDVG